MRPAGHGYPISDRPKPIPRPKPGRVKVVRAILKYTATRDAELSFEEGDILYVFDQSDEDWWKARCKDKTGLVPSTYVESLIEEVTEPLHDAARRGNLTFLEECLGHGVSATGLDSVGNTPLSWASLTNHGDCAKSLLKRSVVPANVQNIHGDTPLHLAAAKDHYGMVELLLECGADPSIKNKNGDTPEKLASNPRVINLLQKHLMSTNSKAHSSFNPEEYDDELE